METSNVMLRILNLIPQTTLSIEDFKQRCDMVRFIFLRNQASMETVFLWGTSLEAGSSVKEM